MNTLVLSGWKRIAAVCAVAFVSLSMLFTVAYPRQTHAATVAELQAQIQTLLAQLAQLQSGAASSCYAFTRDLTLGATGSDVTALQNYLKSTGHFPVTTASTGYFGAITRSAVAAWQAGNGVAPAAGYWGMLSRGKYNAVCKPVTPTPAPSPSDDDSDDDANDDDDEDNDLSRGEADIRNFESLNEFDNEDVDEGDEVEVFGFTFDVDDADARLERLDLVLEAQANNKNTRPWIYIEEIMVLQDGDEVASIRANRKTDWSKDSDQDNDGRDEYEIRLTKINTVVEEGTSPEFNVVVVAKDNIDSSDSGQEFLMSVDDRGARLTDGDGISHEIGDRDDTSSFTVEEAGEDVELNVRLNRDNLDAATLEIDSSSQSEPFAILSFDLEAENGEIEINELPITIGTIGTSTVTYNNFIADIWLEVDGDEYTDDSAATPNAATSTVTFDLDGDLVIDEGDTVRVDVMVEF